MGIEDIDDPYAKLAMYKSGKGKKLAVSVKLIWKLSLLIVPLVIVIWLLLSF